MRVQILITGAYGQLGSEFQVLEKKYQQFQFHFYNSRSLDVSSSISINKAFQKKKIDYVINCGAFTQVDNAEDQSKKTFDINARGIKFLSNACNSKGATLIHISSDYVYDSLNNRPLKEDDANRPQGQYAKSKLEGDKIIQKICDKWIIIRTSWIYSSFGNNFVKTMLRLGNEKNELNIVNDQVGAPTYAKDIAEIILYFVIKQEDEEVDSELSLLNEIYNFSNQGITTWDAFAKKIFDISGIDCHVNGITTEEYGAKAPRPLWSVLSKVKIETALNVKIRTWESALRDCLALLALKT